MPDFNIPGLIKSLESYLQYDVDKIVFSHSSNDDILAPGTKEVHRFIIQYLKVRIILWRQFWQIFYFYMKFEGIEPFFLLESFSNFRIFKLQWEQSWQQEQIRSWSRPRSTCPSTPSWSSTTPGSRRTCRRWWWARCWDLSPGTEPTRSWSLVPGWEMSATGDDWLW